MFIPATIKVEHPFSGQEFIELNNKYAESIIPKSVKKTFINLIMLGIDLFEKICYLI